MGNIINGHNLRWRVGGTAIAKATDCTISISGETRTLSHKDIGTGAGAGWAGNDYGTKSWEGSCNALYAEAESFETLWTAFKDSTKIAVEFSDDIGGHKKFTGNAVITSLEQNAPDNENVTYSVTFAGDGVLTRETKVLIKVGQKLTAVNNGCSDSQTGIWYYTNDQNTFMALPNLGDTGTVTSPEEITVMLVQYKPGCTPPTYQITDVYE